MSSDNPAFQHLIRTNTVEIAELGALVLRATAHVVTVSYLDTLRVSHRELRNLTCISE